LWGLVGKVWFDTLQATSCLIRRGWFLLEIDHTTELNYRY